MHADYLPVLFMLALAVATAGGIVVATHFLGPRKPTYYKTQVPYEAGADPVGSARLRFDVRFYLVALLFVVFDVEVVYFYPWAVVFRDLIQQNLTALWAILIFSFIVFIGLVYEWKKGALDWK
ncbi:MAG TPA: NADH-quinone oxidoreductase subunit A [Firmicutes bacterium]|nr:NADH-quinone oxidoreductase subunit A [Bacillota bacterium]